MTVSRGLGAARFLAAAVLLLLFSVQPVLFESAAATQGSNGSSPLLAALEAAGYSGDSLVPLRVYAYEWVAVPEGLKPYLSMGDIVVYLGALEARELAALEGLPGVLAIDPLPLSTRKTTGWHVPAPMEGLAGPGGPLAVLTIGANAPHLEVIGALQAWEMGYTGEGSVLGVVDTGVDLSSPGLSGKHARDTWGLPLSVTSGAVLLAPLELGIDEAGNVTGFDPDALYIYDYPMYSGLGVGVLSKSTLDVLVVYETDTGAASFAARSYALREPVLPEEVVEAYRSGAKPPRYGLAHLKFNNVYIGDRYTYIELVVPGLITDVQPQGSPDGFYDTVYLDFSTALAALREALQLAGISVVGLPSSLDFSFADEKPVTIDSPEAGWDSDGDGEVEQGFGSLAGYFADVFGLIIPHVTGQLAAELASGGSAILPLDEAHMGYVWPGLDFWRGSYAALLTDFDGHGTLAAYTAAGKQLTVLAPSGEALLVSGVAPEALVAGSDWWAWPEAPMIWAGLFQVDKASGEPLWLPPWEGGGDPWAAINPASPPETGWARLRSAMVDAVTNSWGRVYTVYYWSDAPLGLDASSLVMDWLAAQGGPLEFFANGNEGPGFYTAITPAASASVVAVGAVTELSFKEYMQLSAWWEAETGYTIGPPGQPTFFTSRGPALAGWPKPEVAAVGWMGPEMGRGVDLLRDSVAGGLGAEAVELFSGTSMATPQTAGSYLLLAQAARELGLDPRSPEGRDLLRAVLAASAEWKGAPVTASGAGIVRADRAISLLESILAGVEGSVALLSPSGSLRAAEALGVEQLPPVPWVHAVVAAGSATQVEVELVGSGVFTLRPVQLLLYSRETTVTSIDFQQLGYFGSTVIPVQLPELPVEGEGFAEIRVVVPYEAYDVNARSDVIGDGFYYMTATLVYRAPDGGATVLNEGYKIGNVLSLGVSLSDLRSLAGQGGSLEVWLGTGYNLWALSSTPHVFPVIVEASVYTWQPSSLIEPLGPVSVEGSEIVALTVNGSEEPGIHSGALLVERPDGSIAAVAPYTVAVAARPSYTASLAPSLAGPEEYLEPLVFTGGFTTGFPDTVDWRVIPFIVEGESLLVAEARWQAPPGREAYASNIDAVIYAPLWMWRDDNGRPELVTWLSKASYELTDWLSAIKLSTFWDGAGRPGYMRLAAAAPEGEHLVLLAYGAAQLSGFTAREPLYLKLAVLPLKSLPVAPGGGEVQAGITMAYRLQGLLDSLDTAAAVAAYTSSGAVWASQTGASVEVASSGSTLWRGYGFTFTLRVDTGSLQAGDRIAVELVFATGQPVASMGSVDVGTTLESYSLPAQLQVEVKG